MDPGLEWWGKTRDWSSEGEKKGGHARGGGEALCITLVKNRIKKRKARRASPEREEKSSLSVASRVPKGAGKKFPLFEVGRNGGRGVRVQDIPSSG